MAECAEASSWACEDAHRRSPDRQRLQASQHHIVFERRVLRQQAYSAKPFQEARKGQTYLSTGQRCPQAVVHPTTEGKMAGFTAGDVKLLWGVEHLGIVVGGTEQQGAGPHLGDAGYRRLGDDRVEGEFRAVAAVEGGILGDAERAAGGPQAELAADGRIVRLRLAVRDWFRLMK